MTSKLSDICVIGIIIECESNQTPNIIKSKSDLKGHGLRYRVKIAGVHDEKTPIKDLPFAYPIIPVTAGTGHGGASQSCNLKVGSRVYLMHQKDDEFLILGSVANDLITQITTKDPWNYTLGYSSAANVPVYNIASTKSLGNSNGVLCQATYSTVLNSACIEQQDNRITKIFIPAPDPCEEKIPLGQIQKEIQSAVQSIQKARKNIKSWSSSISNLQSDITNFLQTKARQLTDLISGFFKKIQQGIFDKIRKGAEDLYNMLFPSERQKAKKGIETALELIGCLFRKMGKRLFGMLVSLLRQIVEKLVNVPLCFIENFATSVISKVLGLLVNSLDAILKPLESILGAVLNVVDSILDIVENILTFITCEEKQRCPEITKWSIWDGPEPDATLNLDFNKVAQSIQGAIDTVGNLNIDDLTGNIDLDFSDIFQDTCNIGPLLCGPPTIDIFGGGGSGTVGNVIVGSAGQILGVDITYPGSGYTSAPKIKFNDSCGIGGGAVGTAILGPIPILPPELNFTATQIGINQFRLDWKTVNAVRIETNFGSFNINGSTIVNPSEKTIYTIIAYNKNNASTTQSVVIDLVSLNAANATNGNNFQTGQITNSPELSLSSTFIKDNIYRLVWTTENAVRVSSNFGIAQNVLNGNKEVSPSVTTEYAMTAYNSDGISTTKTIILSPKIISPPKPNNDTDNTNPCSTKVIINNLTIPEEYPPDEIGVVKIIIDEPGSNYLSAPDGRLGGDGRVWAEANETYVRRADGTYDIPYTPGSVIELNRCDTVVPPCEPKFVAQEKTTYIAPDCTRNPIGSTNSDLNNDSLYPILQNGKYPVILYLCDAIIDNPGLNYTPGDEVVIEPSNGAKASAEFSESGRLIKIKILSGGEGFITRPKITIKSSTGFNASIIPVLCIDKIGTDDKNIIPYDSTKVLHVVDCPGNIYV
jgi:hypothetical protein